MADNDTVKVEIDPAAAYQNQDNVDFEITLTANGPMHDSEIQITVPDGLSDLQLGLCRSELRQKGIRFGQWRGG